MISVHFKTLRSFKSLCEQLKNVKEYIISQTQVVNILHQAEAEKQKSAKMHLKRRSITKKTRSCLEYNNSSIKPSNPSVTRRTTSLLSLSSRGSSLVMSSSPFYTFSPFKRKRTWMFLLLLGLISSTFNCVPNLVFADSANVVKRTNPDTNTKHRDVKPTTWDLVSYSTSDEGGGIAPSTTPRGASLEDLSTPPLTTPSNYRTWKNTNRASKKGVKVGDDFHVGNNEVNNRVDVDWENDVIAFEDEDDDAEIGDDENVFYYYDDGEEEDSYHGQSSMEGIHDEVEEDSEDEDVVVFDGDIYPKVIIIT